MDWKQLNTHFFKSHQVPPIEGLIMSAWPTVQIIHHDEYSSQPQPIQHGLLHVDDVGPKSEEVAACGATR